MRVNGRGYSASKTDFPRRCLRRPRSTRSGVPAGSARARRFSQCPLGLFRRSYIRFSRRHRTRLGGLPSRSSSGIPGSAESACAVLVEVRQMPPENASPSSADAARGSHRSGDRCVARVARGDGAAPCQRAQRRRIDVESSLRSCGLDVDVLGCFPQTEDGWRSFMRPAWIGGVRKSQ